MESRLANLHSLRLYLRNLWTQSSKDHGDEPKHRLSLQGATVDQNNCWLRKFGTGGDGQVTDTWGETWYDPLSFQVGYKVSAICPCSVTPVE